MFGTETLITGVSMRALGAGRTNGVHCSPFDISRLAIIADQICFEVGVFLIIDHPTAKLFCICPHHL